VPTQRRAWRALSPSSSIASIATWTSMQPVSSTHDKALWFYLPSRSVPRPGLPFIFRRMLPLMLFQFRMLLIPSLKVLFILLLNGHNLKCSFFCIQKIVAILTLFPHYNRSVYSAKNDRSVADDDDPTRGFTGDLYRGWHPTCRFLTASGPGWPVHEWTPFACSIQT